VRRPKAVLVSVAVAAAATMAGAWLVVPAGQAAVTPAAYAACTDPAWAEGRTYTAGTKVSYNGRTYQALVTHTAHPGTGWNPAATPSLWKDLGACGAVPTTPGTSPTASRSPSASPSRSPSASPSRSPSASPTASSSPRPPVGGMAAAPYLYLGWGNPPDPRTVMNATGVKWFTMAFILAQNGCNPSWDGNRPLTGGIDSTAIANIRAAGGDIIPSVGGWSGNKLGPNCSTPEALAAAYQKVVDAFNLKAIDFDIENSDEFDNFTVQDRILNAIKILKQRNPGLQIIVTIPTFRSGLSNSGLHMVQYAKANNVPIDVWTIMPFNFGCTGASMYDCTVQSAEGLKTALKNAFGWTDAQAYARMGLSGMNGRSDTGEVTTTADWTRIRDWARARGLARFTYWSVNRDRAGGSGTPQADWEFTRITAAY